MICVKINPLAPTIPPTATNNISCNARPAIAPATPLKLFNNEIVIGISAPPTRIEKIKPNAVDIKTLSNNKIHKNLGFIAPTGTKIPVKAIRTIVRANKVIVKT